MGEVTEAKAVIERAVAVGSVNATLRHRAGVILAAAGEAAAARVQMETAYTQSPRSEAGRAAWAWLVAQE